MLLAEQSPDRMVGRLPIADRVRQPYGAVHGGALLALAESLASRGTVLGIDYPREVAFGQEINGSLLRTVWEGEVVATAVPVHRGRTAWVWDVRIGDDRGRLVATVRCTIAVRPNRDNVDSDRISPAQSLNPSG
ncbi:MAG: PaaI family thioesterase [Cyanobacteria bacterium REEB65]|nr:PaaI family thioesterase [Cyanobacteria bacterium REEB65]